MTPLPDRSRPRRRWRGAGHIGPLLRDPALTLNELVSEGLAAEGFADFRPAHGTIGQHIADGGSRVTELAELAQVSKPTIVYLVNDLERLGYVERVPDPEDGRAKLVRMTERGARAQRAGREIVARIERDWAELIGREDFDTLKVLLGRLHEGLWPEGGDPSRWAPQPERLTAITSSRPSTLTSAPKGSVS
ncbi:MAG: winged helix-turn-helix transcriptional regulator [Solirubrobacterales bacterium]|nr:winged helix-turn-helix transcriptional regulator [Solirubrobacterales bacterium]